MGMLIPIPLRNSWNLTKMSSDNDIAYEFGHRLFGPFLGAFVTWLADRVRRSDCQKVLFFARDGYMMQRAFASIADSDIPTEYVYFSRKSIREALLWSKSDARGLFSLLPWKRLVTRGEALAFLMFESDEISSLENKYEFCAADSITYEKLATDEALRRIIADNKARIGETSHKKFDLLVRYLNQIGFEGNVAVVDIGWHGSMQSNLELLTSAAGIDATIHGFYVGIDAEANPVGSTEGFLFRRDSLSRRKEVLSQFGLIERLFQSHEGSTAGYAMLQDGTVAAITEAYEYANDAEISYSVKAIQEGSLAYIRQNQEFSPEPLLSFGKNPCPRYLQIFDKFYNIDNGIRTYYLPQKPIYKYTIAELKKGLADSPWKTAFLKRLLRLPLPYFTIYKMLKK